jgi:hypothetical protein
LPTAEPTVPPTPSPIPKCSTYPIANSKE